MPLEGFDAFVLLINLEAVEVLVDLFLLKLEVNADLAELLGLQSRRNEVLHRGLLGSNEIFLLLSQGLIFFLRRSLLLLS